MIQTSATVGNFGPAFDSCSLALAGLGDRIDLRDATEDRIECDGDVPLDWSANVAGRTLDALRSVTGIDATFCIRIGKGQPPGSGLGSSAASAGGTALAFHAAFPDANLLAGQLIAAASKAEGAGHADDVAAVILGGLALVRTGRDGPIHRRVQPPEHLRLAVLLPDLRLLTEDMRAVLPAAVPREVVVHNIGATAFLIDAMHRGDVAGIGAALDDRLATPARAPNVPGFDAIRQAALEAGAHGVCLSGSGPAMVAVTDDPGATARAMQAACPIACTAFEARPELEEPHVRLS